MTAIAIFLPIIAIVGAAGYLPLYRASRHEPRRFPAWTPWVRAASGWVCVTLGVIMGLMVARVSAMPGIVVAAVFVMLVGVVQVLWARDAARHLRER